jgi:hypothetical protein
VAVTVATVLEYTIALHFFAFAAKNALIAACGSPVL